MPLKLNREFIFDILILWYNNDYLYCLIYRITFQYFVLLIIIIIIKTCSFPQGGSGRLVTAFHLALSPHNSKSINQLCLGLPRGLFPSSTLSAAHLIISSSSHLRTWPYHLNMLSCTLSLICTTPTSLRSSHLFIRHPVPPGDTSYRP